MGSKEDAGKGCPAAGGVSSFTIQSILGGGPSEAPREPAGWPTRKRSLSVSSEEEEPDDGWKAPACFCPDPHGPKEPGPKHHPPIPFPCLGKDRTPPGQQRASSREGKLCGGSRVGPPSPGQSRGRAGSSAEGRRRALGADSSARRALGKKPGTQMSRGAVLGKVGLEGECTIVGWAQSLPHAWLCPQYPLCTSYTFCTRGLEVGSERSVRLYRNLFQRLFLLSLFRSLDLCLSLSLSFSSE